jgi:glucose-6-phosphate isomerase
MEEVLLSKDFNREEELYYMFRGVDKKGDVRYDITEIPGRLIGEEFVKTKGHYHVIIKNICCSRRRSYFSYAKG